MLFSACLTNGIIIHNNKKISCIDHYVCICRVVSSFFFFLCFFYVFFYVFFESVLVARACAR